ncbi:hypothetical protein Bbelb_264590 [Branchiostoma belcheri]|nr:hypothetical protein Bbelb_264590 [Branchiostoma belcheri]
MTSSFSNGGTVLIMWRDLSQRDDDVNRVLGVFDITRDKPRNKWGKELHHQEKFLPLVYLNTENNKVLCKCLQNAQFFMLLSPCQSGSTDDFSRHQPVPVARHRPAKIESYPANKGYLHAIAPVLLSHFNELQRGGTVSSETRGWGKVCKALHLESYDLAFLFDTTIEEAIHSDVVDLFPRPARNGRETRRTPPALVREDMSRLPDISRHINLSVGAENLIWTCRQRATTAKEASGRLSSSPVFIPSVLPPTTPPSVRHVGTNTTEIGVVTEPECLGPCEPGTSVNLEGIVWHETDGGTELRNQINPPSPDCTIDLSQSSFLGNLPGLYGSSHALFTNLSVPGRYLPRHVIRTRIM